MSLTDAEKETTIIWSKESPVVRIDTYEQRIITKLKRAGAKVLDEGKYEGSPYARFEVDTRWVRIGAPIHRTKLSGVAAKKANKGDV